MKNNCVVLMAACVFLIGLRACDRYLFYRDLPHGYTLSSLEGAEDGVTLWTPSGDAVVPTDWEGGNIIEIANFAVHGNYVIGEVWDRNAGSLVEYFVFDTSKDMLIKTKSKDEWMAALDKSGISRNIHLLTTARRP